MPGDFKSFYKKGDRKVNTWCRWNDRLDPYGCGCAHDCSYCYAKSLLEFRGLWHPEAPARASAMEVRKALRRTPRDKVLRIGGMTDPFQPAELQYHITYSMLRQLNVHHQPYLIVTKSDLVADDRYIAVLDPELAHIQITITTTDDELFKDLRARPGPVPPDCGRREAPGPGLRRPGAALPFHPGVRGPGEDKRHQVRQNPYRVLEVSPRIKKWFKIDYSPYTLKCGGYEHLPLRRKIELVNMITGFKEKSVGEFVPEHHAYFSQHVNANPDDCCNLKLK